MNSPKISIIMGIYNCEKYLAESIQSILNQTYKNWELILCDDGSTDNTYQIAEELAKKDKRITLIKNKQNLGLNKTLNRCLKKSNGKYIARQDGDDISLPQRLEKELIFLEKNNEYAMVSTNMIYFDENGDWGKSNNKTMPEKSDFMDGNPFCHAPCMVRREVIDNLNGYNESDSLLRVEDYDLWMRMYKNGYRGYNIKECLYRMRNGIEASKRRTFSNRINESRVKRNAYYLFNLPPKYYYKIYIPIFKFFVPKFIYTIAYKNKHKETKNRI